MINLRQKGLPNAITADGRPFLVETDFRVWLNYPDWLMENDAESIKNNIFKERLSFLTESVLNALKDFYSVEIPCPHGTGEVSERTFDIDMDSEYLVGAFMQAYRIDLTTADMHWHLFQALLVSLPEETKLTKAMGYRAYSGSDKYLNEQKAAWSLPLNVTGKEKEELNAFNELF